MKLNTQTLQRLLLVLACLVVGKGMNAAAGHDDHNHNHAPKVELNNEALAKLQEDFSSRLELSLKELHELRKSIVAEKAPLAKKLDLLEDETLSKQKELEKLQRAKDNKSVSLDGLRKDVQFRQDEYQYVMGLLNDFGRTFETTIDLSEQQLYGEQIERALYSKEDVNLSEEESLDQLLPVIDIAIERQSGLQGGSVFPGKALTNTGEVLEGSYLLFGPTTYFTSSEKSGVTQQQINASYPVIVEMSAAQQSGISSTVKNSNGTLPLDASLGNAIKLLQSQDSLAEHIQKGGPVGYCILALGFCAILLALFKVQDISSFKTVNLNTLEEVLSLANSDKLEEAKVKASSVSGIAGELLVVGVSHCKEKKEIIEELVFEKVIRARPILERFLPFLAIVAAAAPLLGLLGTVIGMIKTFNLITIFGTGDARTLSSGISEALITTKFGLVVAVPILILHSMLSRMAKRKLQFMEQSAVAFLNGLKNK